MHEESPHRNLPFELEERIIIEAWRSLIPPEAHTFAFTQTARYDRYRAQFLGTVSSVCRAWQQIILDVAFRFVVVHTQGDVDLYGQIIRRVLGVSRVTTAELAQAHRALFSRAHVTLRLQSRWFKDALTGVQNKLISADMMSSWAVLRNYYRDDIYIPHISDGYVVEIYGDCGAREWLEQCQFTTSVLLKKINWPKLRLPLSVRHLIYLGCSKDVVRKLIYTLPRLTHLTVNYNQSLKYIMGPTAHPSLRYLSLYMPSYGGMILLQPWCIKSALDAGLLHGVEVQGQDRVIVVHGGREVEQFGWRHAQEACQKHGVKLEKSVTY